MCSFSEQGGDHMENTEDFFSKMQISIKDFCNSKPRTGFHIEYLEKASEILALYSEANAIVENAGVEDPRLEEFYLKIQSLAQ